MEEQDQTWTQWKHYAKKSEPNELYELKTKPYPVKTFLVLEFEKMKPGEKAKFRESREWPEVATDYNELQDIRHNNCAALDYQMKIGKIPWGKMDYGDGTWIAPIHPKSNTPMWGPSYSFYKIGRKPKEESIVVMSDFKRNKEEQEVPF